MTDRALNNSKGEERKILQQLSDISNKIIELSTREREIQELRTERIDQIKKLNDVYFRNVSIARNLQDEVTKLTTTRQSALSNSSNSNNRASMFGSSAVEILKRISKERFHGEVVGPMGLYMKLSEHSQINTSQIERSIGGFLDNYLITDGRDLPLLLSILKQCCTGRTFLPKVYQHTPDSNRYKVNSIPTGKTVLDCLVITNDNVYNCLIDQIRPHEIAYVQDERELRSLYLATNQHGDACLKYNLSSVVTSDGTSISYRYGNQTYSKADAGIKNRPARLSADIESYVRSIDQEIIQKSNELRELNLSGQLDNTEAKTIENEVKQLENDLRQISGSLRQYQRY